MSLNDATNAAPTRRHDSFVRTVVETLVTVVVAVALALGIQAFLVKPYRIPSLSMWPTLEKNQRILVNRLGTHPGVGDVVVFHPPMDVEDETCGNRSQGLGHAQACDRALPEDAATTPGQTRRRPPWRSPTNRRRPRLAERRRGEGPVRPTL